MKRTRSQAATNPDLRSKSSGLRSKPFSPGFARSGKAGGQAATELLIILAVALGIFLVIFALNQDVLSRSSNQFEISKAKAALDDIANAAELVYQQGVGAKTRVYVPMPANIQYTNVSDQLLNINIYSGDTTRDVYRALDFDVLGELPTTEGNYWVSVESQENYVIITTNISASYDFQCGNNLKEPGEQCDGTDLDSQTCITQGYDFGNISCTAGCSFDYTECGNYVCGNNIKEGTELCDGTDLGGETCISQGFDGGTLSCLGNCDGYSTSSCFSLQSIFFEDFEDDWCYTTGRPTATDECTINSPWGNFNSCDDNSDDYLFCTSDDGYEISHVTRALQMVDWDTFDSARGIIYTFDPSSYETIIVEGYMAAASLDNANEFCRIWITDSDSSATIYECVDNVPAGCEAGDTTPEPADYRFFSTNLSTLAGIDLSESAIELHLGADQSGLADYCFWDDINISVIPTSCPDGTCDAGENCPADSTACTDNICYDPTCTNGCGETPIVDAQDPGECDSTTGCLTPPCICDSSSTCVSDLDTTPPSSVTNLANESAGIDWIYWTWINPIDADFDNVIIYLNESNLENTSNDYYNVSSLIPDTYYNITIHTKDNSNNINNTDVSNISKTLAGSLYSWQQIFFDDFNRANSGSIGGSWTETGGAWDILNNRGHADNCDSPGDQITSSNIDLSGQQQALLTFDYQYDNLDNNECLSLDVNDGSGWVNEVFIQCSTGNNQDLVVDGQELNLTDHISMTSTVQLRYDCLNSRGNEEEYIDNVNVSAYG